MSSGIGPSGLALATLLETAAATAANPLYNVQIAFGPPDQSEKNEIIALLGVDSLDEVSKILGPQPNKRDETYGLLVAIRCEKPGDRDPKNTWTRGWTMYNAVREIVLKNQSLPTGGTTTTPGGVPVITGGTATVSKYAFPVPRESTGVVRPLAEDGSEQRRPGWAIRIDMAVICDNRG